MNEDIKDCIGSKDGEACEMINEFLNATSYLTASQCVDLLLLHSIDNLCGEIKGVFDKIAETISRGEYTIEINTEDLKIDGSASILPIKPIHIKVLEKYGYNVKYNPTDLNYYGYITKITIDLF